MMNLRDRVVSNAQAGEGPCAGCSAYESGSCEFVNPGLLNPAGELVFVTQEPSHAPKWENHDTWNSYNDYWGERFKALPGGQFIARVLTSTPLTIDDVWVTDSIKCPTVAHPERGIPSADTKDAYTHCRTYLRDEIEQIDPRAIVTLGKDATMRTLEVLGVPETDVGQIRVTQDYGLSEFDTAYPVIVSLHWAQRTVKQSEWVPVVQDAIQEVLA